LGKTVQGTAADGHGFSMYRADPAGDARGGLVIVQEIFGVNSHIRAVCDDYAAQGYVAVAPALFDRVERGVELGYQGDDVSRGRAIREKVSLEQALADVEAAAKDVAGAGRIGVVGYCWGGTVAWVAATRSRTFAAAVSYYGGGVPELAEEQPNCPVQLHFGEQDQAIPLEGVDRLKAAHPELPVYLYPAGHGFNCDQRASYHAESARLARERTLAFLREHVG
jgi:carboxymethylenebutenolidase